MSSQVSTRSALKALSALVLTALFLSPITATAEDGWRVDASHTEISFSVKHFFTPVVGRFGDFEIDLDYDAESPQKSSVAARIKVASIDTNNERRDGHLRTPDWFAADDNPLITFKSTSVRKAGKNKLVATGPLSIRGKSKVVQLPIEILGMTDVPESMRQVMGGTKKVASFKADLAIDRNDFDVGVGNWASAAVVGKEVNIEILIEAHH